MLEVQKVELTEEEKKDLIESLKKGVSSLADAVEELPECEEVNLDFHTSNVLNVVVDVERFEELTDAETRLDVLVSMVNTFMKNDDRYISVELIADVLGMSSYMPACKCDKCEDDLK